MSYAEIVKLKLEFNLLYKNGEFQGAVSLGQSILKAYKKFAITSGKLYANDCFDIAYAYEEIGDFNKAIKLYTKSAALIKKAEGKTLEYSHRINNLGLIYIKMCEYEKAMKYLNQCLDLREKLFGEKNEMTIQSLYNLGNACYEAAFFEKSAFYLERALSLRRKKDKDYTDNLNSLGYAYLALEDYDNAFSNLCRALGITGDIEGPLSAEYMGNLYFLANLLEEQGEKARATEYMDSFVTLAFAAVKEKYPRLLQAFEDVPINLKKDNILKETKEGSGLFQAENLSAAGQELFKKGNAGKAIEAVKEALRLRREFGGRENLDYIKDLILLSSCYYEIAEVEKTINIFYEIVEIVENEKELFDECFHEMIKAFAEFDGIISEGEKGFILEQITEFMEDCDFDDDFNHYFFDDFE